MAEDEVGAWSCDVCRRPGALAHAALGGQAAVGDASALPPPGAARVPSVAYSCRRCNFDMCSACAIAEEQATPAAAWLAGPAAASLPASARAPAVAARGHAHLLLRVTGGWRGASATRRCDECGASTLARFHALAPGAPPGVAILHSCVDCDYDRCVGCTAAGVFGAAGAAATAAAPPDATLYRYGRWSLARRGNNLHAWRAVAAGAAAGPSLRWSAGSSGWLDLTVEGGGRTDFFTVYSNGDFGVNERNNVAPAGEAFERTVDLLAIAGADPAAAALHLAALSQGATRVEAEAGALAVFAAPTGGTVVRLAGDCAATTLNRARVAVPRACFEAAL